MWGDLYKIYCQYRFKKANTALKYILLINVYLKIYGFQSYLILLWLLWTFRPDYKENSDCLDSKGFLKKMLFWDAHLN